MRAAIYIRLSVYRGGIDDPSVSPATQENACRDWCAARGWEIDAAHIVRDLDVSGSDKGLRLDRPGLRDVRALAAAGAVDVVVAARIDRLARSTADFLALADELAAHGVALASVAEHLDLTTPGGRFSATVLAAVAEAESSAVAARVAAARATLAAQHRYGGGPVPLGYRPAPAPDGPGRVLVVDDAAAALLAEVCRRVVRGETLHSVAAWLNAGPHRPPRSEVWRPGTLRDIIHGSAILGHLQHRGRVVTDPATGLPVQAWPPAVAPALVRAARAATAPGPSRGRGVQRQRASLLLSGLARCGSCGGPMYASRTRGVHAYACAAGSHGGACPRKVSVKATDLDERVTRDVLRAIGRLPVVALVHEGPDVAEERAAAADALDTVALALRDADDADEGPLLVQRRALRDRLRDLDARAAATTPREVETGETLAEEWPRLTLPERRALLVRVGLAAVMVHPARSHARADREGRRVDLVWSDPDYLAGQTA